MATNYLSPVFNEQTFNSSGDPAVSWQIETYVAGTSTPLATYTTQSGTTQQANPIILNARGEPTNPIWLGAGQVYKFVLKDDGGAVIRTIDNVGGINDTSLSISEWNSSGYAPTYISAVSFSVVGDKTSDFAAGRRIRSTNSGGTIYSTISTSSYSSGTGLTTVTVRNDSGTLDAGLSAIDVGILMPSNSSVPNSQTFRQTMGLGYGDDIASAATVDFRLRTGNIVRVTGTTTITTATMNNGDDFYVVAVGALPINISGVISYTCTAGDTLHFVQDGNGTQHVSIEMTSVSNQIQPVATPTLNANAMTIPGVLFSLDFRNATLGTGGITRVTGTPSDLVVPAGATLGTQNGIKATLYDIVLLNGSTLERAIVNNTGGVTLDEQGVISTTAIGTGSDSANVIYSNSARSNVPYRVVGRYESTQSTAGNWATAMSLVQGMGGQVAVDEVGQMTSMTTSIGTTYTNINKRVLARFSGIGQLATACQIGITINGVGPYEIAVAYAGSSATGYWSASIFLPPNARWTLSAISGSPSPTVSAFYQIVD